MMTTTTTTNRAWRWVIAATVLPALLAGCGADDDDGL